MQRRHYIDGLDGLRTLAVAVVMIYHLHYGWAPGGLLGVGIFFVLSGYLITGILLRQWNENHQLDFKGFWIRRAKRLLPALFTVLIAVSVWSYFFNQDQLPLIRKDSLAAVFYVSNWWYIFHDVSYFQSFSQRSPFEHLWSLAVEEQFYIFFPLLLWVGLRWMSNSKWLLGLSLGLAVVSASLMAWLFEPGIDPSRVYFGTDTRSFALLIGCALAILHQSHALKEPISKTKRWLMDALGMVCLIILLGFIFGVSEYNVFLFRGGLVLLSIISAILIAVIVQPTSMLGSFFAWKPLKWLGERSYGIYLWHFPVIILSNPISNVAGIQWLRIILQIFITIVLATVSYRWIENPIRYGTISRPGDCEKLRCDLSWNSFFGSAYSSRWSRYEGCSFDSEGK
ncbi:acyltransferase [Bacillus sp. T3]|uniref:acyltransferase family protein n=1 Tax=Bacillus sp. T3 TaxID=467262 RepID=UPI0029812305|nr:acyltransferase [Bacillus sp. T3]